MGKIHCFGLHDIEVLWNPENKKNLTSILKFALQNVFYLAICQSFPLYKIYQKVRQTFVHPGLLFGYATGSNDVHDCNVFVIVTIILFILE